jgi:hypothetical protein
MIKLLKMAIKREKDFISGCESSDQKNNPQVIEMRVRAEGRLEAFEAALYAKRGSFCLLNIYAKEIT